MENPLDTSTRWGPGVQVYTHARIVDVRGLLKEARDYDILRQGLSDAQLRRVVQLLAAEDQNPIQTVDTFFPLDNIIAKALGESKNLSDVPLGDHALHEAMVKDFDMSDLYEEIIDLNEAAKVYVERQIPVALEGFEATKWVGIDSLIVEYNGPREHKSDSTLHHFVPRRPDE